VQPILRLGVESVGLLVPREIRQALLMAL
jgi:hypothetical protein